MSERPNPRALYVLAALVLLEAAALAGAAVYLVVEIFVAPTASLASAIALAVCAAIAAAGLTFVGISTVRARPWIRGATICWQIIQILVAISILQANAPSSPPIAWSLIVPAIVIVILLFTRSVMAATSRSRES